MDNDFSRLSTTLSYQAKVNKMGMRPARMCSKCHNTAVAGGRFCAAHNVADIRHPRGPLKKLYDCKKWKLTRQQVLALNPVCTNLINSAPCPRLSTDVHHVVDAEEYMARGGDFYDQDNLQALCHTCHTAIIKAGEHSVSRIPSPKRVLSDTQKEAMRRGLAKSKPVVKFRKMDIPSFLATIDHGLTAAELSKIIGIPARTLYRQAKTGLIPSFHVGFAVRFDPHVIGEWLRAR